MLTIWPLTTYEGTTSLFFAMKSFLSDTIINFLLWWYRHSYSAAILLPRFASSSSSSLSNLLTLQLTQRFLYCIFVSCMTSISHLQEKSCVSLPQARNHQHYLLTSQLETTNWINVPVYCLASYGKRFASNLKSSVMFSKICRYFPINRKLVIWY